MKALEHLKTILEKEIEKTTEKGAVAPNEIEALYKVVDIIKDIDTIHAMEDYGGDDEGGYSKDYSRRGSSYGRHGSYDGYSYRRGRDSMGRYASRDYDDRYRMDW